MKQYFYALFAFVLILTSCTKEAVKDLSGTKKNAISIDTSKVRLFIGKDHVNGVLVTPDGRVINVKLSKDSVNAAIKKLNVTAGGLEAIDREELEDPTDEFSPYPNIQLEYIIDYTLDANGVEFELITNANVIVLNPVVFTPDNLNKRAMSAIGVTWKLLTFLPNLTVDIDYQYILNGTYTIYAYEGDPMPEVTTRQYPRDKVQTFLANQMNN